MNAVAAFGRQTLDLLDNWGQAARFFLALVRTIPRALGRFSLVVEQVNAIGNRSLTLILAAGLAV